MQTRNPYQIDRYAADSAPRGIRGALSRGTGMIGCLIAMAALCLGMLYLLAKATGR